MTGVQTCALPISALNGTMFEVPVVGWEVHKFIIVKSFIVLSSWIFGYFGMKHLPLTIVGPINATRPVMVLVGAMRAKIPVAIRNNPDLRILMSVNDFDKYDDELTQRESKNTSETDVNARRYKGITIETLAAWPDDLIVCTLCSPDAGGNLFAAVNLQDDEETDCHWCVGLRQQLMSTGDRKSTRLNSSHDRQSRMPSSA